MIDHNPKKKNGVMKKVSVFYPKKNISSFTYEHGDGKIEKRNYDENGEFIGRDRIEPSIEHYEVVSENEFIGRSNEEIQQWVVHSHNVGDIPSEITEKVKNGELNVAFSSFSAGCIIKIDSDSVTIDPKYYISDGMVFEEITEEFIN